MKLCCYADNAVDGGIFLQLNRDDMKEIIKEVGTIRRLQNFQQKCEVFKHCSCMAHFIITYS